MLLSPLAFRIWVSHSTQEPPSKSLPAAPGIQQGASRRTKLRSTTPCATRRRRVRRCCCASASATTTSSDRTAASRCAFPRPTGVEGGVVIGAVAGLVVGPGRTSWGQFTIARAWLAARRQLPLRLLAFLDDAHQRGVLRQAGTFYQFRHALLQDHLADTSPVSQPTADRPA